MRDSITILPADITLFGATGFTGRLIAKALSERELSFRLAGRSPEKLAELSASLPNHPHWIIADAAQPATLPALFQETRLLINCAGPFTDLGERVITQAAMSGVHYLDTTNELGYVFRARGYHQMALRSGAAVVPACAFEVALADCAAHLAAAPLAPSEAHPLDEVNVVYKLGGIGASQGTRRSAIRSLATSWVAYRDGSWTGQIPGGASRRFPLPGGDRFALSFPSCESITVPLHSPVLRVDCWMTTSTAGRVFGPLLMPIVARLTRSILRGLFLWFAARGGLKPAQAQDPALRAGAPFLIYVQARRETDTRWSAISGQDPYGLTASIIAYAAEKMLQPGYAEKGFLAPSQAFDPRAFLDYARDHWSVQVSTGALKTS